MSLSSSMVYIEYQETLHQFLIPCNCCNSMISPLFFPYWPCQLKIIVTGLNLSLGFIFISYPLNCWQDFFWNFDKLLPTWDHYAECSSWSPRSDNEVQSWSYHFISLASSRIFRKVECNVCHIELMSKMHIPAGPLCYQGQEVMSKRQSLYV